MNAHTPTQTKPSTSPAAKRPDGRAALTEWLAQADFHPPRRGEIRQGEVIARDGNALLVDIGTKRDAIVPPEDLRRVDESTVENLDVGDAVSVYVVTPVNAEGNLIASLSKGLEQQDWEVAREQLDSGEVFESEITGTNKGGVLARFGRLEAFVPNSQVTSLRRNMARQELDAAKAELVGQTLPLKIIEVDPGNRRLVASQRAAERVRRKQMLATLKPEQVRLGRVVGVTDFGAFVDLGGVDGLLHISEMAWNHIGHPSELVEIGQEIEVLVMEVEPERERVRLSRKRLPPKPTEPAA